MMRKCDGNDPNLRTVDNETGNCGKEFDDVNHSVLCPHPPFLTHPLTMSFDPKAGVIISGAGE